MRLIDADALKEEFRQDTEIGVFLRRLVDIQPIAYNIDKVVEELEKCECASGAYDRKCWLDKAIEIVKQGGVRKDVSK